MDEKPLKNKFPKQELMLYVFVNFWEPKANFLKRIFANGLYLH